MVYDGPILDDHFHLNRAGLYLDAVSAFKRVGGTDLVLVHCPDFSAPPTTYDGHLQSYRNTVSMAKEVREMGIGVRVILGPHPAAFAHQFESMPENAEQNYWDSIHSALELVHEGEAVGIGEVGRPHWPVSEEVWQLANRLLEETMDLARKEKIPLQLHVEGESESTYFELGMMADRVGLDKHMLVRHYAPPDVSFANVCGLTPSVLAGSGAIDELMATYESSSHGFFLETDYMDDPRRPGAVLGPKTVAKRTKQLIEAGLPEDILWNTHQDLANRIYGE